MQKNDVFTTFLAIFSVFASLSTITVLTNGERYSLQALYYVYASDLLLAAVLACAVWLVNR